MSFIHRTLLAASLALSAILASTAANAALASDVTAQPAEQVRRGLSEDAKCTRCHDESESRPILSMYQTPHGVRADDRTPTCQSCHGPSDRHLAGNAEGGGRPAPDIVFNMHTYQASDPAARAAQCLSCHSGSKRSHWDGSQHQSQDLACNSCHKVHVKSDPVLGKTTQPQVCFTCHKTERAQVHRVSTHPIDAGKMACSDCHNPHGSTGPKLLVKNSVNETCYSCHAEKRGPFLWEHSPVADDCTNCHTPHGSANNNLLKARPPFLCQECHQDHGSSLKSGNSISLAPGTPAAGVNAANSLNGQYLTVQGNGRACLNCHVMVHGSNHPAGAKLNR